MRRWHWLILLILIAFVLNTIAGFAFYRAYYRLLNLGGRAQINERGAAAAKHGWLVPGDPDWPTPDSRSVFTEFGYEKTDTRLSNPENGNEQYIADVSRYGWPLPVFEQAQFWWPYSMNIARDRHETGLRVYWPGFFITPIVAGTVAWLLWLAPVLILARVRRKYNCCAACGYPIGVSPVCTECGAAVASRAA